MPSDTVIVTGFGPFDIHRINASWEAVKLLPTKEINAEKVVIEEIAVQYQYIDKLIPSLWELHDPKLVVHVGVSHLADKITLETQAFRTGYLKPDCVKKTLLTGEICQAGDNNDCIEVGLDVKKICATLNKSNICEACESKDAGRYLCEYTLYKSLSVHPSRTLFVHVPMLGKPYSAEESASALVLIINSALKQLEEYGNENVIENL